MLCYTKFSMGQSSFVTKFARVFKRTHKKADQYSSETIYSDTAAEKIAILTRQLETEKWRNNQLVLLSELSQQLDTLLDQPVAAQMVVNTLERGIACSYVCIYTIDTERKEFVLTASAGQMIHLIPPGYRQNIKLGIMGRTARLRKTQISNDTRLDLDYFPFDNDSSLSSLVVPIIQNGYLHGMLQINAQQSNAFHSGDVSLAEAAATELTRAWERSRYQQHMTELIQAGISLSTMIEPQSVVREVATITRRALNARFVYVILLDQNGNFSQRAYSGHAPKLLKYFEDTSLQSNLTQAALNALQPFRIRDTRKYPLTEKMEIDNSGLRSALALPIRLHRLSVGAILAFGKENEIFFTENDESLGTLLASQSAAAMESTWLYQELRNTLTTTTQLYQVSFQILQIEDLQSAVKLILETAFKVANASAAGVVLSTPDKNLDIELAMDANGIFNNAVHPTNLIEQVLTSGASIFLSDKTSTQVCFPVQTNVRRYGGLWLKVSETLNYDSRHTAALQTLVNQLERAILLNESRQQTKQIEAAYEELEVTYDHTLAALMSALDARDRETEGHSLRVSRIAGYLGEQMGLDSRQLKALERGSLLHDIGKIGVSDTILHKPGPLNEEEWKIMRLHPEIGKKIVEDIPFLLDTLPVIRYHQERWDGSGYPMGLKSENIPMLARIFSVADAFDALTSDRPYRQKVSFQEALSYLKEKGSILFDPEVVKAFEQIFSEGRIPDFMAAD